MEQANLTVKQGQAYIGVGRKKMYELVNSEGFPSFRIGKKILINREALDKWMKEQVSKKDDH